MIPSSFAYHRAASLDEATQVLVQAGEDARPIAGGQSLIPFMRLRFANPSLLVDLAGVPDLRSIRQDGDILRVGALVRHREVETSDVVRQALPLLGLVAAHIGDGQVRNRGTIGGAVAHADPAAEYPALCLALDAQIVTTRRTIASRDFFVGRMTTPLEHGEIVTEVAFRREPGGHAYLKFGKNLFDWALLGVLAQRTDAGWRIGLVNAADTPVRCLTAENVLAGGGTPADAAAAAAAELDPIPSTRASAEYKRHLAGVLIERALHRAAQ